MSFRVPEEHEAVRRAVREFGENEVRRVADEYETEQRYPHEPLSRAADLNLVAVNVPEAYGGPGMNALGDLIVTE